MEDNTRQSTERTKERSATTPTPNNIATKRKQKDLRLATRPVRKKKYSGTNFSTHNYTTGNNNWEQTTFSTQSETVLFHKI